jgi:hypothetical protein
MNEERDEDDEEEDEEEEERTQTEESAINVPKESRRQKISEKIVDQKIRVFTISKPLILRRSSITKALRVNDR